MQGLQFVKKGKREGARILMTLAKQKVPPTRDPAKEPVCLPYLG